MALRAATQRVNGGTDEAGAPPWAGHVLAFVAGLHRSGTTQLHATLATHPDVSGFHGTTAPHDEGQHLQTVLPTARAHGGPGRFAFDPTARLDESSRLATDASAAALFAQWSEHWDLRRRVLIEKSPPNLVRTRFLQRLFPDARFVVIVRHPAVTALATRKLATTRPMRLLRRQPDVGEMLEHWFAAHRILLADLPHVAQRLVLRWEDLCLDPQGVLGRVVRFLDLPGEIPPPDLDPAVDRRYGEEWVNMQSELGLAGRRTRTGQSLHQLVRTHQKEAEQFGYDLADPRLRRPLPDI